MNIMIVVYTEEGALDPESLLGYIAMTDGAEAIKEKNTYIDSWFDALIRGLRAIREERHCVIDLIDEPEPLAFNSSENGLLISYGDTTINAGSIEAYAVTVRSAVSLFLETIREEIGEIANESLDNLQRFVAGRQ